MNIFIVDDHPLNVDSYVSILTTIRPNKKVNFHLAYNCEQAYTTINNLVREDIKLDIAFIDIRLEAYSEKNMFSGDDIGLIIQEKFPKCKIIIISMHSDPIAVNRIIKVLNPLAFISKNDIDYKSFNSIMKAIDNNEFLYTKSINDARKEFMIKNINWDEHDSKLIQLIAKGVKTKDLPLYIPLSLSAIEKRKANLKKQLIFEGGSDTLLIERIKEIGLFNNSR